MVVGSAVHAILFFVSIIRLDMCLVDPRVDRGMIVAAVDSRCDFEVVSAPRRAYPACEYCDDGIVVSLCVSTTHNRLTHPRRGFTTLTIVPIFRIVYSFGMGTSPPLMKNTRLGAHLHVTWKAPYPGCTPPRSTPSGFAKWARCGLRRSHVRSALSLQPPVF